MRTFIGIPLPVDVREKIRMFIERVGPVFRNVKWVDDENYHITLKFLGEVGESTVKDLGGSLKELVSRVPPFTIGIEGFGAFPSLKVPRVLWVGVGEGAHMVGNLHSIVEEVAERMGFPREEKRFHPHVTVGRVRVVRKMGEVERGDESVSFGSFTAERICLYRSTLTPKGAIYDIIESIVLGERIDPI